jgi:thiamine pyrophosphate-dependent acetolactate synthase large subunit-like protein
MGRKTVGELLVDVLAEAGVERIYGAGAEAHLTGKLPVCAGSCGPPHSNRLQHQHRGLANQPYARDET